MAKLRRPKSKTVKTLTPSPAESGRDRSAARSTPAEPAHRSTYFEAVAVYERALAAIQRHEYGQAAGLLQSVLTQFPDEKELHERVRLYLTVCERKTARRDAEPQTLEERLYAATLALNGGRHEDAITQLRLVRDEDPDNDYALYMLAVAHAHRGEIAEALAHLERSIALNPENRGLARTDPDLESLRDDEAFRTALDAAPLARQDRRRPLRTPNGR
jgi:tetratricopeptide (TPR) repeat protein